MGRESVHVNPETGFVRSKLNFIAVGRAGHALEVSSRDDFLGPEILEPGTPETGEIREEVHRIDERKPSNAFARHERLGPREGRDGVLEGDLASSERKGSGPINDRAKQRARQRQSLVDEVETTLGPIGLFEKVAALFGPVETC
jgi:hypothetical protein